MDWNDVRIVLAVARCGGLAEAGRTLGMDATTVARRIKTLEAALGAAVFERLRGRYALTALGQQFTQGAHRMEREAAQLARLAADAETEIRGCVRISAVDAIVTTVLAPRLEVLRQRHPALDLELSGSDRNVDLGRREADIAIRLARPADSGELVARHLGRLSYAVYGSASHPVPLDWRDAQDWVSYEADLDEVPEMRWLAERFPTARRRLRCNATDVLAQAVAAGWGLGVLPDLVAERRPGLRKLSGDVPVLYREAWMVYAQSLRTVPRIAATLPWLQEAFRDAGLAPAPPQSPSQ